jgi:hypothetical protein
MNWIQLAIIWTVGLFLGGMFAVVVWGLLTQRINTAGLMYGRRRDRSTYFSPERVQLLVLTIAAAGQYLFSVLTRKGCALPDAPPQLVALLGASHSIYLAGKALAILKKRSLTQ